jgi:hypothetical protein
MPEENTQAAAGLVLAGLVTRQDLEAAFHCGERTIRNYEAAGLPVIRRGALRLYDIEAVRAWLRGDSPRRGPGRPRKAGECRTKALGMESCRQMTAGPPTACTKDRARTTPCRTRRSLRSSKRWRGRHEQQSARGAAPVRTASQAY